MSKQSRVSAVLFPVLSVFIGVFVAFLVLEAVVRLFPVYSGLYAVPVNAQQPVLRFVPNSDFTYSRGWNFRGVNTGHINQPRLIARHKATGEKFEYPDDGHWNEAGHFVVAEAVRETRTFREPFGL